ncbi:MAG: hypothetical protein AAGA43_13545 [Bacteroidota bacterium]
MSGFEDWYKEQEAADKDFFKVLDTLRDTFGWNISTVPEERKITAQLINQTIKATKIVLKEE